MAGKTKTLTPDIVLKSYWDDKEHFADLFNAALFGGRQVIHPQELEDDDTVNAVILKNGKQARGIRTARDNIKLCRGASSRQDVRLVLLGQESQSRIHYAMPLRVMGYDYGTYKRQYDRNAQKYKAGGRNLRGAGQPQDSEAPSQTGKDMSDAGTEDRDEFLSKMKRTNRFIPVITVVFHNHDNADLFQLLRILLNPDIPREEAKQKAIQYSEEHDTDSSVIMTVAGATGSNIDLDAFGRYVKRKIKKIF